MNRIRLWGSLLLVAIVLGGGMFAWWNFDLRWRPQTITKNQAEITKLLEGAGWVSPGNTGPKLYMVSYRACPECVVLKQEEFPGLQAAKVDTRVIVIAQPDLNGVAQSTPVERATVAELWLNRSWPLMERWQATPPESWRGPGVPPADGDMARTAVVEAGRKFVADLEPLLKANGVKLAYPLLVWWTADGTMRACACDERERHRFVRKELGAVQP